MITIMTHVSVAPKKEPTFRQKAREREREKRVDVYTLYTHKLDEKCRSLMFCEDKMKTIHYKASSLHTNQRNALQSDQECVFTELLKFSLFSPFLCATFNPVT